MKCKIIAALIVSTFATAFAHADSTHECQGNSCNGSASPSNITVEIGVTNQANGGSAQSSAKSAANSTATALQTNSQQSSSNVQTGDTSVSVGSTTQGNSQNVTFTDSVQRNNTPSVSPSVGFTTAPCTIAVGGSVALPGFGMGMGGSVTDQGCDVWRDAQNLLEMGFTGAARMRLCAKKEIAELLPYCNVPMIVDKKWAGDEKIY